MAIGGTDAPAPPSFFLPYTLFLAKLVPLLRKLNILQMLAKGYLQVVLTSKSSQGSEHPLDTLKPSQ